ncbi:MAG: toprim domain-containing protein [Thermoplasmataceae archaeon]
MPVQEKKILRVLESYREENLNVPVVVEGTKDMECLRKLDFTGEVIPLNNGRTLLNFSEELSRKYRKVIILTDFDRKGSELKSEISAYLESLGTDVDTKLWDYFRKNLPVRTVEELPRAVEKKLEENRKLVDSLKISRRLDR